MAFEVLGESRSDAPCVLPAWARAADILALTLLVLVVCNVLFGGVRFWLGPVRLSLTSLWLPGAALVCAVAIRHLRVPSPSLAARVMQPWRVRDGRMLAAVAPVWLTTRLLVIAVGFIAVAAVGTPETGSPFRVSDAPLANLAARWDSGWYLGIAVEGYQWNPRSGTDRQQNVAFFPAFPLLMRVGGALLGARATDRGPTHVRVSRAQRAAERLAGRTLLAGWLLALAASFAALCALYRWAAIMVGAAAARRAAVLLSVYPFAFFFSTAYTESFFLLGSILAFTAVGQGRPLAAGGWGLFVGLLRPNGFLLAIPLAVLAARGRSARLWAAAAAPGVGMLLYAGYVWWLTGSPFTWARAHAAWGRTPLTWAGAVLGPIETLRAEGIVGYVYAAPIDVLNGAAFVLAVALLPVVWRRLGPAPTLFVLVNIVPPLVAGGLMSMGRITATLFPLFVALALVVPARHLAAISAGMALVQGLAAALFFTWRPLV